jgi:AcrR family transcriptional regulator
MATTFFEFNALHPGPGRRREEVRRHQRARLQAAMIEMSVEYGFPALTIRALCRRSHVSSGVFYEHFGNLEECFLETHEWVMEMTARRLTLAARRASDPRERLRIALTMLANDVVARPDIAEFALITPPPHGKGALAAIRRSARKLGEAIDLCLYGDQFQRLGAAPLTHLAIVAGLARVARRQILNGHEADMAELVPDAIEWIWEVRGGSASDFVLEALQRATEVDDGPQDQNSDLRSSTATPSDERTMILLAASKLAATDGYAALTPASIRRAAGVSRKTFDIHFTDVRECFLAAVDFRVRRAFLEAGLQDARERTWSQAVYQGILRICGHVSVEPGRAIAAFAEVRRAGRPGLLRRAELISAAATAIRGAAPQAERPSALSAEASAAAVWALMHYLIEERGAEGLEQMAPALSFIVLAPGIGHQAALDELQREQVEQLHP